MSFTGISRHNVKCIVSLLTSGYKSVLQLVSMGISNLTDLSDVIASLLFCVPEVDTGVVPSV